MTAPCHSGEGREAGSADGSRQINSIGFIVSCKDYLSSSFRSSFAAPVKSCLRRYEVERNKKLQLGDSLQRAG